MRNDEKNNPSFTWRDRCCLGHQASTLTFDSELVNCWLMRCPVDALAIDLGPSDLTAAVSVLYRKQTSDPQTRLTDGCLSMVKST